MCKMKLGEWEVERGWSGVRMDMGGGGGGSRNQLLWAYLLGRVCTVLGCSTVLQHSLVLHGRVVCG